MENLRAELVKNNQLLKAVLAFQISTQGGSASATEKPEFALARFGISYQDIAEILGKKPDAVRMLLKRNKTK